MVLAHIPYKIVKKENTIMALLKFIFKYLENLAKLSQFQYSGTCMEIFNSPAA